MGKRLAVFDFDHTIIKDNSDVVAIDFLDRSQIPKEVWDLHKADCWTVFMQAIFKMLQEKGIDESCIRSLIEKLPEVPGMSELIKTLNNLDYDVIIISDSNSYFIDAWLNFNNLKESILKVFTNPAKFHDNLLKVDMYHYQTDCKLSSKHLCKGRVLTQFLNETNVDYEKILYCGDGQNDFCPILRLKETDLACVRKNFKCEELVKRSLEGDYIDPNGICRKVLSEVLVWQDGYDIINFIQQS